MCQGCQDPAIVAQKEEKFALLLPFSLPLFRNFISWEELKQRLVFLSFSQGQDHQRIITSQTHFITSHIPTMYSCTLVRGHPVGVVLIGSYYWLRSLRAREARRRREKKGGTKNLKGQICQPFVLWLTGKELVVLVFFAAASVARDFHLGNTVWRRRRRRRRRPLKVAQSLLLAPLHTGFSSAPPPPTPRE